MCKKLKIFTKNTVMRNIMFSNIARTDMLQDLSEKTLIR